MLLDTPSLYFRAFHGVPRSVRAPDGTPVNAVRGLLDTLARQIAEIRPTRLVACFDADWRPRFRVALLESYKAHRVAAGSTDGAEDVPAALTVQLPVIDAVLDAAGIARISATGYEADDVIGTLAVRDQAEVDVLTGDRDLFQLVDDSRPVRVRYAVERFAVVDEAAVADRFGIPGRAYADFAVLRGDPSDGLPGVPGIGAKTASALLAGFGSLAAVRAAAAQGDTAGFPAGSMRRIVEADAYLDAAVAVVGVVTDVDLPPVRDRLPAQPADHDGLARLARRWGVEKASDRLLAALAVASATSVVSLVASVLVMSTRTRSMTFGAGQGRRILAGVSRLRPRASASLTVTHRCPNNGIPITE
ncbi:5'-3' exonuclease [Candidatus Protofrankia californiensis]|uniref:5'-3' exonuclease n=1 Tax=Candidatus Protofrankia californiensis TaxID=1839754 RepID=A0A1C3P0G4_9ACTN|nr:5'-3' exonuclease [Candidatus Protofrankia californiensis]